MTIVSCFLVSRMLTSLALTQLLSAKQEAKHFIENLKNRRSRKLITLDETENHGFGQRLIDHALISSNLRNKKSKNTFNKGSLDDFSKRTLCNELNLFELKYSPLKGKRVLQEMIDPKTLSEHRRLEEHLESFTKRGKQRKSRSSRKLVLDRMNHRSVESKQSDSFDRSLSHDFYVRRTLRNLY